MPANFNWWMLSWYNKSTELISITIFANDVFLTNFLLVKLQNIGKIFCFADNVKIWLVPSVLGFVHFCGFNNMNVQTRLIYNADKKA